MGILALFMLGCLSGFFLFRKNTVAVNRDSTAALRPSPDQIKNKLSVIIPARNEAINLPHLLDSLQAQTWKPFEIIVVDDASEDDTKQIAQSYEGVTVIANTSLPPGWTGKNWAVWNGYLHASGELIAFLDADVRLAPRALESLIKAREKSGGVISVVPFHQAGKLYERLALTVNILAVFVFTSVFESKNPKKGLYGSCILTTREDYEKVKGHEHIKSEVLDDLNLGAAYRGAGIPVTNFIGYGLVSFRMYPQGLKSELQGISKSAALSTATVSAKTIALIAVWLAGLIVAESAIPLINTSWALPLIIGYALYTLQIFYFIRYIGYFGIIVPVLHIVSTLFFVVIMLYSLYQVMFLGHVSWKGRNVKVGGR